MRWKPQAAMSMVRGRSTIARRRQRTGFSSGVSPTTRVRSRAPMSVSLGSQFLVAKTAASTTMGASTLTRRLRRWAMASARLAVLLHSRCLVAACRSAWTLPVVGVYGFVAGVVGSSICTSFRGVGLQEKQISK